MKHEIRTYNASGKCLYEEKFRSAEKCFEAYVKMAENLALNLPKGHEVTIVRYNDGYEMSEVTITGVRK